MHVYIFEAAENNIGNNGLTYIQTMTKVQRSLKRMRQLELVKRISSSMGVFCCSINFANVCGK